MNDFSIGIFIFTGDVRINQNLGNTLLHNIFLRFHNYIASELFHINQFWTDEELYHEARKIIGAVIQHITYHHYLPIILGMHKYFCHAYYT